ncbi:hypothetical protein V6N13_083868 [Hibiscus sabdariffa]|uniref:Uncharacterized protein n=1 Tax=Hibiscus sabdariffa TaxID=183260 RepID=A0ABR2T028_9ROSI
MDKGLIAAGFEQSWLNLFGKEFTDIDGTKLALATLSEPVISGKLLLFAPENVIQSYVGPYLQIPVSPFLLKE